MSEEKPGSIWDKIPVIKQMRGLIKTTGEIREFGNPNADTPEFEDLKALRNERTVHGIRLAFWLAVVAALSVGVEFLKDVANDPTPPQPAPTSSTPRTNRAIFNSTYDNYVSKESRFGGYMNEMHKLLGTYEEFSDKYVQEMYDFLQNNTITPAYPKPLVKKRNQILVVNIADATNTNEANKLDQKKFARLKWCEKHKIPFYDKGAKILYLPEDSSVTNSPAEANLDALGKPFIFAGLHDAIQDVGDGKEGDDKDFTKIFRSTTASYTQDDTLYKAYKPAADHYKGKIPIDIFVEITALLSKTELESVIEARNKNPELGKIIDISDPIDSKLLELMVYARIKLLMSTTPENKVNLAEFMPLIWELAENPQLIQIDLKALEELEKYFPQ